MEGPVKATLRVKNAAIANLNGDDRMRLCDAVYRRDHGNGTMDYRDETAWSALTKDEQAFLTACWRLNDAIIVIHNLRDPADARALHAAFNRHFDPKGTGR